MTVSLTVSRVGRDTLIYGVSILLGKVVSFVMLPFYTRYLTPADYGVMQLVDMTLDIVAIIAGSQIASGVFRFYHKAQSDVDKNLVLSTAMAFLVMSFGAFAISTYLAASTLSRLVFGSPEYATLIRLAAASLGLQSFVTVPLALLRLQERSVGYAGFTSGRLILQLTLNILLLAVFGLGVKGIFISTLIANATMAVALGAPFVAHIGLQISRRMARDLLRYGVPLVGMNLATFVVTFGDRYFLRVSDDVAAVGLYSLAYQFGFILSVVGYAPFALMWEPKRFEIAKLPERDVLYSRAFLYMNLLLLTVAVGIGLSAGDFIRIMAPAPFHPAADLVPIILIAYVLQSWAQFLELGVLVRGRTEFVTLANWLAAATALLAYALLIPRWLGLGAAVATVLAFAVRNVATYVASQRLLPIQYRWGPVWRLAAFATAIYLASLIIPKDPVWESVLLHLALFGLFVILVWLSDVIPAADRARIQARVTWPRMSFPEVPRSVAGGMGSESSSNWVWLAAPARWDRVLEIGEGTASLAVAGLSDHFGTVHHLHTTRSDGSVGGLYRSPAHGVELNRVRGSARAVPYRDSSFDCIVLHGVFAPRGGGASALRIDDLRECVRMLRPGGCLHVATANPIHYEALPRWIAGDVFGSTVLRARDLRRLGFARVCSYYADPSIDQPWAVVPAARHAVLVMEQLNDERWLRGRLRRIIATAGLHRLTSRWTTYLAYK
jgi:O-antigen/teichoic acid export membrane protein/SAM-dependent methyltransferase